MEWLTANWFWVLIFILFIGMHFCCHSGHGGHGGHGGGEPRRNGDDGDTDEAQRRVVNTSSAGHQH